MPLSNVPREILLNITDYLDDVEINALTRTNGQIYHFLNPHLYRRDVTKSDGKSLTWSATYGMEGTLRLALAAGRNLHLVPESYQTALQLAAEFGRLPLIKILLNVDGVDPNYGNGSAILSAAQWGHNEIVELLLAVANINPNVRYDDKTPLHWACELGHVSIVRQFLARDDVDLNTLCERSGTPLTTACYNRRIEVVSLLLAKEDVDVNLQNNRDGNTPLMIAVEMGLVQLVESLLTRDDLNPNIANNQRVHVLGLSAFLGDVDIVKLLLGCPNIDINFAGRDGNTALILALDELDVLKLLLDHEGIEVNAWNDLGRTALCQATYWNCLEAAKVLLRREDVDVNISDNGGQTALSWACHNNCLDIVDLLLERPDIDTNFRDNDGLTPLAHAYRFGGNLAIVRRLLSHRNMDRNGRDNNGASIFTGFTGNHWGFI